MMKKFLTFQEAADYLGIQESDLQDIVDKGILPAYKVGGIYTRFKVDDLILCNRRSPKNTCQRYPDRFSDRIKDFFYFNDFYIFSAIVITMILYLIFK